MERLQFALFIFLFIGTSAFVPNSNCRFAKTSFSITANHELTRPSLVVIRSDKGKGDDGGEGEMRNRRALVTESIAPFRGLRLFLYGALGSGAFVGGLINTSGAIAASNSPEFDLSTEVSQ